MDTRWSVLLFVGANEKYAKSVRNALDLPYFCFAAVTTLSTLSDKLPTSQILNGDWWYVKRLQFFFLEDSVKLFQNVFGKKPKRCAGATATLPFTVQGFQRSRRYLVEKLVSNSNPAWRRYLRAKSQQEYKPWCCCGGCSINSTCLEPKPVRLLMIRFTNRFT